MKRKKKKTAWGQYIVLVLGLLIGGVAGYLAASYIDQINSDMPFGKYLLYLAVMVVGIYAAIVVQVIIHEGGHLVFGLLSGYTFSSFRIFSFMWLKEDGRIKLKRFSLAGTGGQCLMNPPDMVDGRIPVVLYNLGGSIMNIITGLVFTGLYFVFSDVLFLSMVLFILAIIGFAFALMNGIPMHTGTVDNDGYNALSLTKNSEAMRSFWLQMKINEQVSKGVRLKDMPAEWFVVPGDEAMKNSMVAAVGVFACNRLMDEQKFEEADKLMAHLLEIDSGMVGLHRNLIICDRIYCELIAANRREVLEEMLTKEQKKFMNSMKTFPSIPRTEYVYALLGEKDKEKAKKAKEQFEKCAKKHPYPNDIQSERELMEIAEKRSAME